MQMRHRGGKHKVRIEHKGNTISPPPPRTKVLQHTSSRAITDVKHLQLNQSSDG